MAILSSHFLNAVDGSHAGDVELTLFEVSSEGKRHKLFKVRSDEGGRLTKEFEANVNVAYEMVIASGEYFQAFDLPRAGGQILDEIVVRFRTPDPNACYHIPVIMAPNSYSCWWST